MPPSGWPPLFSHVSDVPQVFQQPLMSLNHIRGPSRYSLNASSPGVFYSYMRECDRPSDRHEKYDDTAALGNVSRINLKDIRSTLKKSLGGKGSTYMKVKGNLSEFLKHSQHLNARTFKEYLEKQGVVDDDNVMITTKEVSVTFRQDEF